MSTAAALLGIVACGCAALAVVLGRRGARALLLAHAFSIAFSLALAALGAGWFAAALALVVVLVLIDLQVVGWMLIDVDRDEAPLTDPGVWAARGVAFVLLGGALALAWQGLAPGLSEATLPALDLRALGGALLRRDGSFLLLLGVLLGAVLASVSMLLRTDEGGD